jgi:hypothetical protein
MGVADGEGNFENKAPSGKKLPTTFKTERKRGATTNMHLFRSFEKTG